MAKHSTQGDSEMVKEVHEAEDLNESKLHDDDVSRCCWPRAFFARSRAVNGYII